MKRYYFLPALLLVCGWLTAQPKYSGTLPVLFVNTEGNAPIVSKETYLPATYYLDNMGNASFESIGSKEAPLEIQIRGRGNYSWSGFDKKPYRIKLGTKQKLMGMKSSKHFALLAHADDDLAFLRNTVGFELSRRLGLAWTPAQEPVELVLNGDYIGLYFLTETIRVDKDRVNIVEQPDLTTHPDSITGGWLLEIDNYDDPAQIQITEGNGELLRFTHKTPEVLSAEQEQYLRQQVEAMDDAIYAKDKSSRKWEEYIDINVLARYYVVQEILDDSESFHGSCYLYKEQGEGKWFFGPVWDFGSSYHRDSQQFIYVSPPWGQSWIEEIAKFPRFQQEVRAVWSDFYQHYYAGLSEFIDDFIAEIEAASKCNYARWQQYGNADVNAQKKAFKRYLTNRINWLFWQWSYSSAVENTPDAGVLVYDNGNGAIIVQSPDTVTAVKVYSVTGALYASVTSAEQEMTIACPEGVYFVQTISSAGRRTQKVVVR